MLAATRFDKRPAGSGGKSRGRWVHTETDVVHILFIMKRTLTTSITRRSWSEKEIRVLAAAMSKVKDKRDCVQIGSCGVKPFMIWRRCCCNE